MRGDYANLTLIVDLTLSRIDSGFFTGTRWECLHAPEHGHLGDDHRPLDGRARQPRRAGDRHQGRAPTAGCRRATSPSTPRRSLRRLQTDRIDLYYSHKDDVDVPVEETLRAFDELVRDGQGPPHRRLQPARPERLTESLRARRARGPGARTSALQPHYNLVEREGYEREYAPIVAEHGLAVAPYYALAKGFLTGKYRPAATASSRREPDGAREYLDDRAASACWPPWTRSPATHDVPVAAVALAWLRAQPGRRRADRQRAHASSSSAAAARGRPDADRRRARPSRRGLRIDGRRPARPSWTSSTRTGASTTSSTRTGCSACATSSPRPPSCSACSCAPSAPRRVLEIGTSNGYSTIWLGDAAEAVDGTVVSLEIEPERTAQAQDNLTPGGRGRARRAAHAGRRRGAGAATPTTPGT